MNTFLEFNLLVSILAIIYSLVSMKYFLHIHGYKVNWFWGWRRDYRKLKYIIKYSDDPPAVKKKSSKIISQLHISTGYLVLTLILIAVVG
jgi:hypothetical protein